MSPEGKNSMIKIAFLLPDMRYHDPIVEYYHEYTSNRAPFPVDADDTDYAFAAYVAPDYRSIPRAAIESDVVIARGLVASQLRHYHSKAPLVEVAIGTDLVIAVKQALERHGDQPVALLGSHDMRYAATDLGQIFAADFKFYEQTANDSLSVRHDVRRIVREGRKILVCEPQTLHHVDATAIHRHALPLGRQSVLHTIHLARHAALSRRRDREKAAQFQAALATSREGMIVVDTAGRITALNAVAADMLEVSPARAIGGPVRDIPPFDSLGPAFCGGQRGERLLFGRNGGLSLAGTEVRLGSETCGHVMTVRKVRDGSLAML